MLNSIKEIAIGAGHAILEVKSKKNFHIEEKVDQSPVTEADLSANAVIVNFLRSNYPEIPLISEEVKLSENEDWVGWDTFWLIDPLDGTKDFLKGTPEYTVNIALVQNGVPTLGVVHAPELNTTYWAMQGEGSFVSRNGNSSKLVSKKCVPGDNIKILESRSHPPSEQEKIWMDFILGQFKIAERLKVGSSLKFCWVAEGKADLYLRGGGMKEWDVAAGDCIYRYSAEAGELDSGIRYRNKDLRVGPFCCGTDVKNVPFQH